jgi:hypothetical protein
MTRRSIPYPDLEAEIHARMHPEAQKRRGWLKQAAWIATGFLTGIGMVFGYLFGLVFILPVAAVWRRVKR